jgi:hypothetical protein
MTKGTVSTFIGKLWSKQIGLCCAEAGIPPAASKAAIPFGHGYPGDGGTV